MKKKIILLAVLLIVGLIGGYVLNSSNTAKAKKIKKQYKKVYNFTVQGDCTNADADIVWDSEDSDEHALFRKVAIPSIKASNMPRFEFLEKYAPYGGYSGEMWQPVFSTSYYFTDGYLWFRYGGYDSDNPNEGCSSASELKQFRFFVY